MKNIYLLICGILLLPGFGFAQSSCPNNLLVNAQFSNGLTSWSQYGRIPTATVLNAQNGCLDTFLIMQATNNSDVGVIQQTMIRQDSCYDLCYCVEFPFTGAFYNAKVTVAAITSTVTVAQLLSGSFTPSQAQIIDSITVFNGTAPYIRCPASFTATGNFTHFVIVNQTVGNFGTDVRVDNVCLQQRSCGPDCNNVSAAFGYSIGPNYAVTFTDNSTSNPGDVLSWNWDFGDPPSGVNNTSTLQNPTHIYPGPGTYIVCLYLSAIMSNGLPCHDTLCIDLIINPVGQPETEGVKLILSPNPASDRIDLSGNVRVRSVALLNAFGQQVFQTNAAGTTILLPSTLTNGFYTAVIETDRGMIIRKLLIKKN